MLTVEWTPDEGWHDARDRRLRAAHPGPGDRCPALRAGDLRGHEGLPARRRVHLDLPPRGQRRADAPLLAVGWRCRSCRSTTSSQTVDALVRVDQRWVPESRGRRASTSGPSCSPPSAFLGVRPAKHVTYMVIPRRPAPTSARDRSRSRSGSPRSTPAPAGAAWARRRPAATTPRSLVAQQEAMGHGLRPGRLPRRARRASTSRSSAA